MVPDFRRDDVWMPPYQVRGRLLKSGMTEKAVYGQTLFNGFETFSSGENFNSSTFSQD